MFFCKTNKTVCRKTISQGFLRLLSIPLFITMILFGTPAVSVAPDKVIIYFYSSETNINNFKSLKMGFDKYLAEYGSYEFQPFEDRETFEKHIKDKDQCILLLSSWHYRIIFKDYCLKVALAGMRNGKKYQQRILVARNTISNIDSLKGASIASSSSVKHTKSVLMEMFKEKEGALKTKILAVPKDIDALMAVGFGMSKAALTTRNAFEELKNVNPILYNKLKILAEGRESHLLILAVPEDFVEHSVQPVKVIKSMPMNPDGKKKMRMLGLDGWQEPDPSDRQQLEAK
jgi:hypothetical protein